MKNLIPFDLNGKALLVTGGSGSFGRAFLSYVTKHYTPSRLVVYSRDEQKQFQLAAAYPVENYPYIRFFIGDVRDGARLVQAMNGIDVVVHAAALKHVPVAEYNPIEAVKTNIIGAENVINAAIQNEVGHVIALSTDKAANPINLYGATKLCSDKLFIAGNNLVGGAPTMFSVVRYGNVMGSRGSVVPFFQKLIRENSPYLPITDERMTRFSITLEEGIDFVLHGLNVMRGGEIFIPKIPSLRIMDLVAALAPDYPTKVVGIRPGEKLHESMITPDDSPNTLEFESCYLIRPTNIPKFTGVEWDVLGQTGAAVEEDFHYRSDLNDWWLTKNELATLIEKAGPGKQQ